MKESTFIVENYKYGLIECPDTTILSSKKYKIDSALGENNSLPEAIKSIELDESIHSDVILPFAEVDGLSIKELKDYFSLKYNDRFLVFTMYDSLPLSNIDSYYSYRVEKRPMKISVLRYILLIDTEQYENETIDEIVEDHLIRHLDQMNLQNRKKALCFLEKYMYDDKEKVKQEINNYLSHRYANGCERVYCSDYIKIPKRLINK